MDPSSLIAFGSAVKFLDEAKTRIGGHLVRFTGPKDPDLFGDFFTSDTDYGHDEIDGLRLRLYYEHGFDGHFKSTPIGAGRVKSDDVGLWFEAQLDIADEYAEYVRNLIDEGKLGYSSGAVGHLVERQDMGKAAWLKRWPLGEASLTPRPAEPRNIVSLKSLMDIQAKLDGEAKASPEDESETPPVKGVDLSAADAEPADTLHPTTADPKPTVENEPKSAPEPQAPPAASAEDVKALADQIKAMQTSFEESKSSTVTKNTVVEVPALRPNGITKDNEITAFGRWVRTGDIGGVKHMIVGGGADGPLVEIKASNAVHMQYGTAAEGGNIVTDDMYGGIIARRDEAMLANKLGVRRFVGTGTTIDVPVDDEADGEFITKGEETAFDVDSPALGQTVLTLVKYTKSLKITYELLQDQSANIEEFLQEWVGRGLAKTHNNLLITESVANGSELGTTASTTVAVLGEFEAAMYNNDLADYLDDAGSVAWVMKPATYGKIISIGGTSNRYYAEPTGQGDVSRRELLNAPVYFSQKVDAYGTANNRFAHFGNWFSYMGLYESPTLQFLRDPYSNSNSGQIGLNWYFRCDYGVLQSEAGGFIRHITT